MALFAAWHHPRGSHVFKSSCLLYLELSSEAGCGGLDSLKKLIRDSGSALFEHCWLCQLVPGAAGSFQIASAEETVLFCRHYYLMSLESTSISSLILGFFAGFVSFPVFHTCSQIVSKLKCVFVCSFTFLGVLCFFPGSVLGGIWNLLPCLLQTELACFPCAWRVTTNNCQSQQKVGDRNMWPSSVKFSRLKSPDIKINLICLSKCYCSKLNDDVLLEKEQIG